ncbi:MAG: hypothetical protein FWE89_05340 [Syntrophaceae bacterium]|nr:hypothetical protein [Syntrophaceae bacterium]
MKKTPLFLALCLVVGWISGCGDAKDVFDIELRFNHSHVFTIRGDIGTYSYSINLEDNEDYWRYKDKVRKIEIDYLRYAITSNRGGGGQADLYVGPYGCAFPEARKVAQTISFGVGEIRPHATDVDWIDLGYLESVLASGKISLWAIGSGTGIDVIVPVYIQIEVTVNPFE